jgi:hypothetical protein
MAIVRTVLPRKGIIEPQHGENYESDLDTNWQIIDSLLQDANDVQNAIQAAGVLGPLFEDLDLAGVTSGFALSVSSTLVPGLTAGALYAQGTRYAPTAAPALAAAPASATSYLWYNSTSGFYYSANPTPNATGDTLIGQVVASATAVTAVTNATKIFGAIPLAPTAPGNFTVQHFLGRAPVGMSLRMTSGGAIWFQSPTDVDGTNLYLVSSGAGVTGKVIVW